MKRCLLLFFISFAFTSCVWFPEKGFSEKADKLLAKEGAGDFSSIDNPIVIRKGIWNETSLYNSNYTNSISMGNLYVIYDWKTDSFSDWFFASKKYEKRQTYDSILFSYNEGPDSSSYVYTDSYDDAIYVLDSKTSKVSQFKKEDGMFELYGKKEDSILLFRQTYASPAGFQIFNIKNKEFKPFIKLDESYSIWLNTCESADGDFWISVKDKDYNSGNVYILKLDVNANSLKSPLKIYDKYKNYSKLENGDYTNHDIYKLIYSDEQNVYIYRYAYYRNEQNYDVNPNVLIVVNKTTGVDYEIPFPDSIGNNCYIKCCKEINGVCYFVVSNYYSNVADVYNLDLENKKIDFINGSIECDSNTCIDIRDNKLFFFTLSSENNFYQILDIALNNLSEKKIIDFDQIIND